MAARALLFAVALILAAGCASVPDTKDRAWPVKYEEEMATGGTELDFPFPFGRLFSAEVTSRLDGQTYRYREHQVRPIYRRVDNEELGTEEHQILWPIAKVKYGPGRRQARILPLIWDNVLTVESTGKYDRDWIVFPFMGGSDTEQGDYFLLFPFVGKTYNLFGSEEIDWLPWPIYVQARDRDYESRYVMWPLVGWGSGGGKTMLRVLPFFGTKEKEGKSWSRDFLWPFFSWGEEELHTPFPVRYAFFFPIYGKQRSWDAKDGSPVAWQTTFLYPFFMWSGSRRGWREVQLFWPVYRRKIHPSQWAIRVWPFFARSEFYDPDAETWELQSRQSYYCWPIGWHSEFLVPRGRQEYTLVVPFYRRSRYFSVEDEDLGGDVQIWPLFRHRVDENRGEVLSLLAPIPWSNWRNFEANWGWLWTVIEARWSADGTERSQMWLWGLFRHRSGKKGSYTGLAFLLEHARDNEAETEKVELLKGLLGWETSKEEGDGVRILWFIRIPL